MVATQFFRVFRLLRLFKVEGRYVDAFTMLDNVIIRYKFLLSSSFYICASVWVLFATVMWSLEKDNKQVSPKDNPRFGSIVRSLYYSLLMMMGECCTLHCILYFVVCNVFFIVYWLCIVFFWNPNTYTHIHIHTYTYIYIYIYIDKQNKTKQYKNKQGNFL